ncbi:hypothetical protein BZA70DRAFT_247488 [Myxozyma melibiosi]|uniref:DUF410-domain-containing protein n=1 Tax=Myxozyma melibiosi TaxID=54550 RepID=A0ABR1F809_9ASCO
MSSGQLEKTIKRVRQRIADKQYYEAQQAIKTVAARLIKAQHYDDAIEMLYQGSQELLGAGEGGSGGELSRYLVDTYKTAGTSVNSVSKARVVQLFTMFKPEEPRRKDFIQDAIQWSASGEIKYGDPELHHIFGSAYANEDKPYEAERHLLLGTKESATVLGNLLFDWFADESQLEMAPFFISRAVLGYLSVGNIRDADKSLNIFIERLLASGLSVERQNVTSAAGDSVIVFPQLPLLDFFQLLIKACQRPSQDLFRRLRFRYKDSIKDAGAFDEALDRIGASFFGIKVRNQGNMLQDLMGSLLGGPSGGSSGGPAQIGSALD